MIPQGKGIGDKISRKLVYAARGVDAGTTRFNHDSLFP